MGLQIIESLRSIVLAMAFFAMLGDMSTAQVGSVIADQKKAHDVVPTFSVVSVKLSPDSESDEWGIGIRGRNFWAVHVTTNELIGWAYGINARQVENAPEWFATERFDVDGLPDTGLEPTREQYRTMLQSVLADRFALRFHCSQRVLPVYVLLLANGGLKIPRSADQSATSSWGIHQGWLSIQSMTFSDVARVMQRTVFERPVLDQTGLSDRYTFILKWRADETQFTKMQGVDVPQETGTGDIDDIYTASRKQLGMKIEAKKALAPTMIIEAVSHPSRN